MWTRILAFLCQICPFCVVARIFPTSRYACCMKRLEKNCPACNAWFRVHGKGCPRDHEPRPS